MSHDLPPTYDPASVEAAQYAAWEAAGVFTATASGSRRMGGNADPFTVLMPPPNVTAILHVGHGMNNTVQDVLVRWRRMAGDETLWMPGTDHAGIATQNVVEKLLAKEGMTRFDLGREAFVRRTEQFVEETGGKILDQLRGIGASADWTRTAYTLSPELSRAVREAFVTLWEKGLVYKGHRVIHWCPRCLTSLSDEEAEFTETSGKLYHLRYALADEPSRHLVLATTRPETMLGDVAVAVHPDDERYVGLVGRRVRLPVVGLEIPIIADAFVDRAFGTGVVKITPAHDANDFDAGTRAGLPMPVVIDAEGIVRAVDPADAARIPDALRGLDRFDARKRIVALLEAEGALEKVEPHQHNVRHCYRCDTVVEPRLSDQWFVKMAPLAEPALQAVRDGQVRLLPERWEGVYEHWMTNIRDWNISRQLWWGHRIPVFYCDACGWHGATRDDPTACPSCAHGSLRQDDDVLDTWFSSWLWPLSTLGWPAKDTADQRAFYPTDVLVTGPDILFFWVARMIMAGFAFDGRAPFHTVLLTGIARDMQGRKMSKSLGNGIDPLEVADRYGADALRWTIVSGMGLGVDVRFDHTDLEATFAPGRNFATKLWNIGRFLLQQVGDDAVQPLTQVPASALAPSDAWIVSRLEAAIAAADAALGPARPNGDRWAASTRQQGMRLDEYAEVARRFVWNELADWYLEAVKGRLATPGADRDVARAVLAHAFDGALRLLHPIMPFITEALWQRLPGHVEGTWLARAAWPRAGTAPSDAARAAAFEGARAAVSAARELRAEYAIPPGTLVRAVVVASGAAAHGFDTQREMIARLARLDLSVAAERPAELAAHALLPGGAELSLLLGGAIDVEKERTRFAQDLAQLDQQLAGLTARLGNEKFLAKAKPEIVEGERAKQAEYGQRAEALRRKIAALGG
jgi:valyl-tRNA synthetase